jgi:hypothetical protein
MNLGMSMIYLSFPRKERVKQSAAHPVTSPRKRGEEAFCSCDPANPVFVTTWKGGNPFHEGPMDSGSSRSLSSGRPKARTVGYGRNDDFGIAPV